MNQQPQNIHPENENVESPSSLDAADKPEIPNRRELIERFAKAATIAAPLVIFVSRAQAIHSKP
jgi:hypothetical protein